MDMHEIGGITAGPNAGWLNFRYSYLGIATEFLVLGNGFFSNHMGTVPNVCISKECRLCFWCSSQTPHHENF